MLTNCFVETKEGAGFCSDVKKCGVKAPCTDGEAQRQKDKGRNGGGVLGLFQKLAHVKPNP